MNYILADAHEDFPRYPLDVGVPGRLPLLTFPEISYCQMETDDPYHHRVRPPLKRAVSRCGES